MIFEENNSKMFLGVELLDGGSQDIVSPMKLLNVSSSNHSSIIGLKLLDVGPRIHSIMVI